MDGSTDGTQAKRPARLGIGQARYAALIATVCLYGVSSAAIAAATAVLSSQGDTLEEVVVTARKQAENLQDVPLTVTALTSKSIEELQVKNIFDLATVTPGLYYGTSGGRNGGNKLQIRNFSSGTAGPSKASVFIDGVYSFEDYSSIPLANLERIEVLKGPQSAYFGRATFVGAVNFITKDPGDKFSGKVDLLAATEGEHDATGYFSVPIISNRLSEQITFRDYSFKGPSEWHTNDGYHLGNQSTRAITSKTVYTPTDDIKIRLNYTNVSDDDHIPPVLYQNLDVRVPVARPGGTFGYYFNGPTIYNFSAPNWGGAVYGVLNDPGIRHHQDRTSLDYEFKVWGQTVSGYFAHNRERYEEQLDGGTYLAGTAPFVAPNAFGVPTTIATIGRSYFLYDLRDNDDQAELRVSSPTGQRVRYTLGYNYSNIKGDTKLFTTAGAPTFISNAAGGSFLNPAKDSSVFGGLYFDLTDQITVSGEGRYQTENIRAQSFVAATGVKTSDASARYTAFLPRVNVQYKVNSAMQFYALYSEGNNPGGFQPITPAQAALVGVPYAYDEEKIANYEAGYKSTWLNDRLIFNAAVFHMDFTNEQLSQTYPVPTTPTGFASIYLPGIASKVDGVEIETEALLTHDLQVRATVGYGKAVYKNFCSQPYAALTGIQTGLNCRSVNGKQQEGTPALQTSLSGDYTHPIAANWSFYTRADWEYQSKVYNEEWDQSWIPAHGIINARIGIQNLNWTFEGFVRNATDDSNTARSTRVTDGRIGALITSTYPPLGGFAQGIAGQQNVAGTAKKPRQFGLRVAYEF